MFVGHQMVLDISFPTARERLAQFIREGWLRDASGKAHSDGLVGVTRVGPFGAVLGASKLVQVHIADPVPRADTVIVPLRWEATGVTNRLFPVLSILCPMLPTAACWASVWPVRTWPSSPALLGDLVTPIA